MLNIVLCVSLWIGSQQPVKVLDLCNRVSYETWGTLTSQCLAKPTIKCEVLYDPKTNTWLVEYKLP